MKTTEKNIKKQTEIQSQPFASFVRKSETPKTPVLRDGPISPFIPPALDKWRSCFILDYGRPPTHKEFQREYDKYEAFWKNPLAKYFMGSQWTYENHEDGIAPGIVAGSDTRRRKKRGRKKGAALLGNMVDFAVTPFLPDDTPIPDSGTARRILKYLKAHPDDFVSDTLADMLQKRQQEVLRKKYRENGLKGFRGLMACRAVPIKSVVRDANGNFHETGSTGNVQVCDSSEKDQPPAFSYRQLVTCDSSMLCFHCGREIRNREFPYILGMCRWWNDKSKWEGRRRTFVMMTLTAAHNVNTIPRDFVDSFLKAFARMVKSNNYRKIKRQYGLSAYTKNIEMTVDHPDCPVQLKSGIHFHQHMLLFFDHELSDEELRRLESEFQALWVACLQAVGLNADNRIGCQIDRANDEDSDRLAQYVAKDVTFEVAGPILSKTSNRQRLSHWQLMAMAFTSRPDLIPYALAVMDALRGRHWMTTSKGFKEAIPEEYLTELRESESKPKRVVYEFDEYEERIYGVTWHAIHCNGMETRLLRAAEMACRGEHPWWPEGYRASPRDALRQCAIFVAEGYDPILLQPLHPKTGIDFDSPTGVAMLKRINIPFNPDQYRRC